MVPGPSTLHSTSSKCLFEANANELLHLIWGHGHQLKQWCCFFHIHSAPSHLAPHGTLLQGSRLIYTARTLPVPVGPAAPPGCDDGCKAGQDRRWM